MDTAINLLLLLLLIFAGLLYFSGLGWFTGSLLLSYPGQNEEKISFLRKLPLFMVTGMITNYGLMLIFRSCNISMIIGAVLAIAGLISMVINQIKNPAGFPTDKHLLNRWIGIAVTSGVLLIPFLVEPISRYDARTIWFFHSKMIYYAGTLGLEAGWQNPFINFSHRDYPNLVPVIAAQISTISGYWNEYLPKLSLYLVLLPGIIWMFSFARRTFSYLALFAFIPFSFSPWLWNGYMDGALSFYFCISLLLIGAYFKTSKKYFLISVLVCMLLLVNIKNEGVLAMLSLLLGLLVCLVFRKIKLQSGKLKNIHLKPILGLVILCIPFILWSYYKKEWGLINDLGIGSADSLTRFLSSIQDGGLITILKAVYPEIISQLILFSLFLFSAVAWKIKLPSSLIPVILTTSLYFLGVTVVYLLTPRDLSWHLNTSVSRTMLMVNGGLILAWYLIFEKIENQHLLNRSKITRDRNQEGWCK